MLTVYGGAQSASRRTSNVNLLQRLQQRESGSSAPGTAVVRVRQLYDCLAPVTPVKLAAPPCHICKFTPSGEYLVCFGGLQHELILFRYRGLDFSLPPDAPADYLPESASSFESSFELLYQKVVAQGDEVLCKDFCLAAHGEQWLVLASSSAAVMTAREGAEEGAAFHGVPAMATTTFHLVRRADGEVCDRYVLEGDFVQLSHAAGAALGGDLLALLAIRSQAIHMLQVQAGGRLVRVRVLGRQLREDDRLTLALARHRQAAWLRDRQDTAASSSTRAGSHASAGPSSRSRTPPPHQRRYNNAAQAHLSNGTAQRHAIEAPPAAVADDDEGGDGVAGEEDQEDDNHFIEGLKQRLLAYMFLQARSNRKTSEGRRAVDNFYFHFHSFANMVIWKVQFLDERHLLLSLGGPEAAVSMRHAEAPQHTSFLAVYDTASTLITALLPNTSRHLLHTYLHNALHFHAADASADWERFVTPQASHAHASHTLHRQLAQDWSQQQVTRRILGALPAVSQSLTASPYLDANLFQYDEKLISPVIRSRAFVDLPVKFVSRAHPELLRFKIMPLHNDQAPPPPVGRPNKQLVTYYFHPVQPFVLCVLQTFVQPAQLSLYIRI